MFELPDFLNYWYESGLWRFVRVFWYFVIFELTRYILLEFGILLIYTLRAKKRAARKAEARRKMWIEMPLLSVIAPGKNEGKNIFKLVNTLREQTYTNLEIIIVDDGSDDESGVIGKSLEKNGFIDKFVRNEMRGGKASAANLALRFCNGKFCVHLDADSSFDRDAMEEIILPFYMDEKVGGVGGNVKVRNTDFSLCTKLQAIEYLKTISVGRIVTSYLGIYRIISGAFGAFRMDALKQVGGWDIGPGLDGDITVKLRKSGYKIKFVHEAVCLTNVPTKFKVLWKQRSRWSKSLVRFRLRKHKDVFRPHKGFSVGTFFGFVENIFYNFVLDIKWYIYVIDMLINYSSWFFFIIPFNILLYIVAGYMQQFVAYCFSERREEEKKLWLYVPFMVFYTALFLRLCRTYAYFKELFFKSSYKDPWNPQKSSYQAYKHGV